MEPASTRAVGASEPKGAIPRRTLAGPDAERLAADVLRAGGALCLAATGHSMTPAIRSGDRLTVEPQSTRLGIGAVLACESEGRLVVHRLVGRDAGRAVVRGDAAPAPDPPLADGAVLGVVVRIERGGRPVRLGLGRERVVIAWLSRRGLLRGAARWREQLRFRPRHEACR